MDIYINILIGTNTHTPDWLDTLKKINKQHIIIADFNDDNLNDIITKNNIDYILPLSNTDYNIIKNKLLNNKMLAKKYMLDKFSENIFANNLNGLIIKNNIDYILPLSNTNYNIDILYPNEETYELLNNKMLFTKYMLEKFSDNIPDVYYLYGEKLKEIEYPVIYKPVYSSNGYGMEIFFNDNDFLQYKSNGIIQKFIIDEYEYGAFMLCVNGFIATCKIIKFKYEKYNIKTYNFPSNYETVNDFNIELFKKIIGDINYSGGMCINFKYNELLNNIYIFEMNPRFGGSAFTCNFIYDLLCIKIS